jgi:multidrug resistance efflux pump
MSRVLGLEITILATFALVLAIPGYAQQAASKASAPETQKSTKTRMELLNELSLKAAQVVLEHAAEAYKRYKREYENAQRLFDQSIISKKELDEALSAYAQAEQQLKQAEIQLEMTKLGFLDNATHITIMEARKYYDSQGTRMLGLVLKNTRR